jgi:NAD(P)-dependent dehydrogenase (short-subunit alcohol dehydrogenase family)
MSGPILEGRVALITGASRGLGKSIALALGGAGAQLALVARDKDKLAETAAAVRGAGGTAETYLADVSDEGQVLELERAVIARF